MIWLAVFPTLLVLNLALGDWLRTLTPVLRTFVLATIAVPIVIYGLMPQLHRAPQTPADPERRLGRKGQCRNDFSRRSHPPPGRSVPELTRSERPSSLENIDVTPVTNGL